MQSFRCSNRAACLVNRPVDTTARCGPDLTHASSLRSG
jgi:hypothetical protein